MDGLAAASDGTVYLGLRAGREVWLAVSQDDARTFAPPFMAFEIGETIPADFPNAGFRAFTTVELAVDTSGGPHDGRLYAVWSDYGAQHADVLTRWSDDAGRTWSEPVRINADRTAADQWMARVVVAPDGLVHVVYFDRARDPDNRLIDAVHAVSRDAGGTWRTMRLTQHQFDGDLGIHQNGVPFIGDYLGIGASHDAVWVGFPTTVTGVAEVAVAKVVRAQTR